jgi:hypothetical protein
MDALRDPIWQFVGVVVAVLAAGGPGLVWLFRRRARADASRDAEIIAQLKAHVGSGFSGSNTKHKKRKSDGILIANLSSDFLNQFPMPVAVLAAHLDHIYTPENFGASDWLGVFRRFTSEGYFEPTDGRSPGRITVESTLNPGPKMQHWLKMSAQSNRSIAGLEDG